MNHSEFFHHSGFFLTTTVLYGQCSGGASGTALLHDDDHNAESLDAVLARSAAQLSVADVDSDELKTMLVANAQPDEPGDGAEHATSAAEDEPAPPRPADEHFPTPPCVLRRSQL